MAPAGLLVFAGKSVAAPVIKEIVKRAFKYLDGYFSAESMEEMKSKLEEGMPKIEAVFEVVNPERIREQSSALDAWLWKLRDAVEVAEDAIDELEYYELKEKAEDCKVGDYGSSFAKMRHKAVRSVSRVSIIDKSVKQLTYRGTLKRLMKAMDGLDKAVAGVAVFLTLTDRHRSSIQQQEQLGNNDRETGSTLSATKFVGREKEKEQIIEWLNKTSVESAETVTSANSVPIISVVGHGGMGKTTLAQSICEEDEVRRHFKVIWVTVSNSIFDATSVTSKILECATGAKPSASRLEPLQQQLIQELQSINFFLVLDDVWEDKERDEWEKLFAPLRKVKTGSKILLTTRKQSVADMAANVMGVERDQCLTLGGLEEDENIELFNHHVFSGPNPQNYAHLKPIGEKIAKKLGGCPLVTKVVGGHLQGKDVKDWNRFLLEGLEHFEGTEEDIMKVLRLSYYDLPTDLQICFRYCSLFPQDHRFKKEELVQMWMGSGLISQVTSGSQTFEDIGGQFLDQLTRKSFFDEKSELFEYGSKEVEYYVMHDLMHDLARNASYGECARITYPDGFEGVKHTVPHTVRHLCVAQIHESSVELIDKISQFKNLRSIIVDSKESIKKDMVCALEKVVQTSKSLRLFHSRLSNTFNFADKFANFKHLRYIYVHQMSPEGICRVAKLYHLMVLRCDYKFSLHKMSPEAKEVRYLGNLEHLRYVSYGVDGLGEFPVSRLTYLQELENYKVGGSTGNTLSSVGNMRSLRKLKVKGIENIENHEEAKDAKLKEKQHLSSLSLEWYASNRAHDMVLDHLEPHGNIRELRISGYEGVRLLFWIENLSVKNLISLKLERCIKWEHLPSLGELVLLKYLILEDLPKLQQIGSNVMELSLPPSLENLEVKNCEELRELPILPPTLVRFEISHVGLTKLPSIGKLSVTMPSELLHISVEDCPCLTSLEGSLLEQTQHMGAPYRLKK